MRCPLTASLDGVGKCEAGGDPRRPTENRQTKLLGISENHFFLYCLSQVQVHTDDINSFLNILQLPTSASS